MNAGAAARCLIAAALTLPLGCGGGSTPTSAPPTVSPPSPAPPSPPPAEPLPPCAGVSFEVAFGGSDGAGIGRGALTLDAEARDTALTFVSPYTIEVPEGGANLDVPGLRPTIGAFVSDLVFTPFGDGFRQTMTLEWLSELRVEAGLPGCVPVGVTCDLARCAGS